MSIENDLAEQITIAFGKALTCATGRNLSPQATGHLRRACENIVALVHGQRAFECRVDVQSKARAPTQPAGWIVRGTRDGHTCWTIDAEGHTDDGCDGSAPHIHRLRRSAERQADEWRDDDTRGEWTIEVIPVDAAGIETTVEHIIADRDAARAERDLLTKERDALRSYIAPIRAERDKARQELNAARARCSKLQEANNELTATLDRQMALHGEDLRRIETLTAERDTAQAELAKLSDTVIGVVTTGPIGGVSDD